jgi:hypothetical protein
LPNLKDCLKLVPGIHKDDIADIHKAVKDIGDPITALELFIDDANFEIEKTRTELGVRGPVTTVQQTVVEATTNINEVEGYFNEAENIIVLFRDSANLTTAYHELFHYFRPKLVAAAESSPRLKQAVLEMDEFTKKMESDVALKSFYGDKIIRTFGKTFDQLTPEEKNEASILAKEEVLASAFERYVAEGKAPSVSLMSVFNRFREWIAHLYKGIKKLPGIHINDNIRGAFDKMLATEGEVQEMKQMYDTSGALYKLLNPEDSNKIEAYREKADKQVRSDIDKLITSYFSPERKAAIKAEIVSKVDADPRYILMDKFIKDHLDIGVVGTLIGFDAAMTLKQTFPKAFPSGKSTGMSKIRMNNIALKNGYPGAIEMLNDLYGLPSKKEAINKQVEEAIEGMEDRIRLGYEEGPTIRTSLNEDGDVINSEEPYLSDERLEYMVALWAYTHDKATEAEKRNAIKVTKLAIIETAKKQISELPLDKISRVNTFLSASVKAGQSAAAFAKSGNIEKMQNALYLQALHIAKAKEAVRVNKAVMAYKKSAKKLAADRGKTLDSDYADLIRDILNHYGLANVDLVSPKNMKTLDDLTTELQALESEELLLVNLTPPSWLVGYNTRVTEQEIDLETGKQEPPVSQDSYKKLTFAELEQLMSYIKLVKKLKGNDTLQLGEWLGTPEITYREIVDQLVEQIRKHDPNLKFSDDSPQKKLAGVRDFIRNFSAINTTLPLDMLLDRLDFGDKTGPFHKFILNPLVRAYGEKTDLEKKYFTEFETKFMPTIDKFVTTFEKKYGKHTRKINGVDLPWPAEFQKAGYKGWTANMWFMALMHTGTEDNKNKLQAGYGLTDADINVLLSAIGKDTAIEMFKLADDMRDFLDQMFQPMDDMNHRIYGQRTEKIAAKEHTVTFSDGSTHTLKGGYVPLAMDPNMTFRGAAISEDMITKLNHMSTQNARGVPLSSNKQRTETSYPVHLELATLVGHISRHSMFVTTGAIINDIGRLFKFRERQKLSESGEFLNTAVSFPDEVMNIFGRDVTLGLVPALSNIAQATTGSSDMLVGALGTILARSSTSLLGGSISSMLKNSTAVFKAWEKFGFKFTIQAYYEAAIAFGRKSGDRPWDIVKKINAMDGRMDSRMSDTVQRISTDITRTNPDKNYSATITLPGMDTPITLGVEEAGKIAMTPIVIMDMMTTYPIYWKAYQDHLRATGDERAAKDFAFSRVADMQPIINPVFQNELQRGGRDGQHKVLFRAASFMLSWSFRVLGDQRNYIYLLRSGQMTYSDFVMKTTLNLLVPAMATGLISTALALKISKGDDGEEESFLTRWKNNTLWDTASNTFGGFWFSGIFMGPARYGRESSSFSFATKKATTLVKDIGDFIKPNVEKGQTRGGELIAVMTDLCLIGAFITNVPVENFTKNLYQFGLLKKEDDK